MKLLPFLLILASLSFGQTAQEYFQQAQIYANDGNYKIAIDKLNNAIQIDATNPNYYDLLVDCYFESGAYQESFDMCGVGIYLFPETSIFYNKRAGILFEFYEIEDAILDYDKAIEYAEDDEYLSIYYSNRGGAKSKIGNHQGAYEDLLNSYALDSTNLGVLNNLGIVSDELGYDEESLKHLFKALELAPNYFPTYINIGFKYQEKGEHEKAIEYFDKALELSPNEAYAFSNRSYNKYKLGNLKGAMKDIEISIKLDFRNSYAYKNRALIYIAQKKYKKACEDIQLALDHGFTKSYGEEVLELQKKYCKD